jgi:integrase
MAAVSGKTVGRSLVTFRTVCDQWLKTVLPTYKTSTQKNHRHIVAKHLDPRFGDQPMSALTRQVDALSLMARTMTAVALLTGIRRGELFALRWRDLDLAAAQVQIREAVYEGTFGSPKTKGGRRLIPLTESGVALLTTWHAHAKRTAADDLVFATRSGKPISPNNVLRQWIRPAADSLGLKRVSFLTFRRTYATWAHEKGVPGKIVAQVMGHAKIDTTLNIYTQVRDESVRAAIAPVGEELFKIVQSSERVSALIH